MKHALIIEDREVVALMIEDELAELGYATVAKAASQMEAILLAEQKCPDLITADDRLADGSGIAAVHHICRHQAIPVVFITADAKRVKLAVPDAVILEKPFSRSALVSAIQLAVEGARIYS
jgi:CheY-like chemotaxis protein